jgi:hypothetical protein
MKVVSGREMEKGGGNPMFVKEGWSLGRVERVNT